MSITAAGGGVRARYYSMWRSQMSISTTTDSIVRIGDREFSFQRPWDGRPLTNRGFLALDTETEAIDDINRRTPRLALATASAGDLASAVIHPDQVGRFI